ncbi:transporter substrate-binding domain-containing protein [Devosia sp. 1566]|uniref:transporter substrate-binding domain-containing protein n=1 Tax=Devosia sp. 1566 TaxID=2499144 RepID=UPI000FD73CB2|nr:transporter substrate-binding domain-containing protein [Devosia sp. 1566]
MLNLKTFTVSAMMVGAFLAGAMPAHADLLEDIMAAGNIRISTDLAMVPSGMLDGAMTPIGSDVETAQLLAADWGLELEIISTTGATRIPNLQTNKADIVISTLSVTDQRKEVIDFSRPYAAVISVVGAPAATEITDWEDLRGTPISVVRGTTQDSELTAMAGEKGIEVVRYEDDATLVTAAISGQAAAVATSATVVNQIKQRNTELSFEPKVTIRTLDVAIGVRKGEEALVAKLNEWISANMANGKLNEIYLKYHGSPLPEELQQ